MTNATTEITLPPLTRNQALAIAAASSAAKAVAGFSPACVEKHGWTEVMIGQVYESFMEKTYKFLSTK